MILLLITVDWVMGLGSGGSRCNSNGSIGSGHCTSLPSSASPPSSSKIDHMVAAFLTSVYVSSLYIHYHCLLSDSVWHGSTTLTSNTVTLQLRVEIFAKSY